MRLPPLAAGALLVAAGGAVGSVARYGVGEALPPRDGWPVGTLAVNLLGSFLLGFLLEELGRRGPESVVRRRLRLALGTGVLGGFTTYSSLAVEAERLVDRGDLATAVGYVGATVVLGLVAAVVGVALAAGDRPWREDVPLDPDAG